MKWNRLSQPVRYDYLSTGQTGQPMTLKHEKPHSATTFRRRRLITSMIVMSQA